MKLEEDTPIPLPFPAEYFYANGDILEQCCSVSKDGYPGFKYPIYFRRKYKDTSVVWENSANGNI
jgi:hypothetical protein